MTTVPPPTAAASIAAEIIGKARREAAQAAEADRRAHAPARADFAAALAVARAGDQRAGVARLGARVNVKV